MSLRIARLDNAVQNYAWGSRTAIAELLGGPSPAGEPEAELWLGAHPRAPSRVTEGVEAGRSLDAIIASAPRELLGERVHDRFGKLPFLLKILAAETPLSIQAHPDLEQAQAGFRREEAAGIPRDARHRNYKDDNHKPELICALEEFWALKGFRPEREIARHFRALGEEGSTLVGHLENAGIEGFFRALMTLEAGPRETLSSTARELSSSEVPETARTWVERLAAHYPGDVGVLSPLFLNVVRLEAGQALFLRARELHAYLRGTGIEIMASSDNVLRGGLTPKHVDVPELLDVLRFEGSPPEILTAERHDASHHYPSPAPEFSLSVVESDTEVETQGPEILLTIAGGFRLLDLEASRAHELPRGASCFVSAGVSRYRLEGTGRVVRARVPA